MMEASPNIHEIFHSPPVSLRVFIWHHMHFSHPFYEVVRPPLEHHSFFKKPFIRVLNVTTSGAQPFSSILKQQISCLFHSPFFTKGTNQNAVRYNIWR